MTPNPFPLQIVEKVNSPDLLAFLQQFGYDKYADAVDINKIVQALQFIYENLGGSAISDLTKFTVRPTINISGTAVLVSTGSWLINGVSYNQTEGASFSFSLNDEGKQRFVLIIAGTDGDYNTVEGEQSATNPAAPSLALNTLLVSIILISDSSISEIPLSAIEDLISDDADNTIVLGVDGKLYSAGGGGGSVPDATETVKGKIQIATEAQRVAGSNDTTAITPLKLKATADEVTEESANYSDNLVNNLLDGVSTPGNTLLKLYNLILGASAEDYVADITARNAYDIPHLPFSLFVTDDGDGKWAKYQATTTGVGATFVKISDPDLLNAVMSAAAIKAAYESNSDTNAFTNALKTLLLQQSGTNSGDNAPNSLYSGLATSKQDVLTDIVLGALINGYSSKTTPVGADGFLIRNYVDGKSYYVSYTNLSATLKAYFDSIYATPSLIVKRILNSTVETTLLTGTTSETLIYSAPVISGGSLTTDDYFNFQAVFRKQPGNSIGCTYRVYVSNTNNFATASLLATWSSQRFNTVFERRNIFFKADNTLNSTIAATTSTQTDLTNSDAALSSISLNPANDIYFFVSAQLGVGTDNVKMTAIKIYN
jgi:hypothetical protein